MNGEQELAGWSGELDADLGLSAGIDLSDLLGFEAGADGDDDGSSVDVTDLVQSIAFDGGVGAGFESALELLDVGEDLNDG